MTKDENIWTGIKFLLLLLFSVALTYILLCKYFVHIPESGTEQLVKDIDESEAILADRQAMADKFDRIRADIDSLNFEVQQVQHTSEIKADISQASKFLQGYFDIRENFGYTVSDNRLIEEDLEKIKANI